MDAYRAGLANLLAGEDDGCAVNDITLGVAYRMRYNCDAQPFITDPLIRGAILI